MSQYKITVTKIDGHPDGTIAPTQTEVFSQTLEEFNLSKFVLAVNKTPRTRKSKTPKAA